MSMSQDILRDTEKNANQIRVDCLRMGSMTGPGGAHFGSALSMVEIMAVLYSAVMKVDPSNPSLEIRDRFILSKGHGAMSYYAALKLAGFVSDDELMTFKSNDTFLYGHPSMDLNHGIEFSTGSLGLGLGLGVGTAMGLRLKNNLTSRTFVLMGDGECNEGSVWESAASASHFELSNLVAIVDQNGLQYDGKTVDILDMGSLESKFESFGWEVRAVDGHNISDLYENLRAKSDKPVAVIAKTVKGKGISFMENNPAWHHSRISQEDLDRALLELQATK